MRPLGGAWPVTSQDNQTEQTLIVDIRLSRDEMLGLYKGTASRVSAIARDGRSVSLPLTNLRPYLTWQGVRGSFLIRIDGRARLKDMQRLPD